MIYTLGNVVVFIGASAATAFCVAFQMTATWWKSEAGKHLMSFTAMLAVILWYIGARSLGGDTKSTSSDVETVRFVIFSMITGMLIWRCVMLGRYQIWASWRQGTKVKNGRGTRSRYRLRRSGDSYTPRGAERD